MPFLNKCQDNLGKNHGFLMSNRTHSHAKTMFNKALGHIKLIVMKKEVKHSGGLSPCFRRYLVLLKTRLITKIDIKKTSERMIFDANTCLSIFAEIQIYFVCRASC